MLKILMKRAVLLLLFLLLASFCFSQKNYKVKQGELQFINPDFGIILKKDSKLYQFFVERGYYLLANSKRAVIGNNLIEIDTSFIDFIKNNKENIYPKDIENYDFKKLDKVKFVAQLKYADEVDYERHFLKYNNEYFATLDVYENGCFAKIGTYCIVEFDHNKKILLTFLDFNTMLIPTKKGIIINNERFYKNRGIFVKPEYSYKNGKKVKINYVVSNVVPKSEHIDEDRYKSPNLLENYTVVKNSTTQKQKDQIADQLDRIFEYRVYTIDTLPNHKMALKNYFGERVLPKTYDSIIFNNYHHTLVCYDKKGIHLYNNALQKIKLNTIRDIKFYNLESPINPAYITGYAQILQGNKIKIINKHGEFQNDSLRLALFKKETYHAAQQKDSIHKGLAPKYKKLGDFEGNFARFESFSNQRGWLSLEAKEYLDEEE